MKIRTSLGVLAIAAVAIFTVSCQKNSTYNSTTNPSNMTLITEQVWVYDTAGIGADNSGTIVSGLPSGLLSPCQTDDTLSFSSNGTGSEIQGPIACVPPGPQSVSFQWSFNSTQNMITSSDSLFTGFGGSITITSLTSTELHLLKTVTISGLPVIVDIYLKHP